VHFKRRAEYSLSGCLLALWGGMPAFDSQARMAHWRDASVSGRPPASAATGNPAALTQTPKQTETRPQQTPTRQIELFFRQSDTPKGKEKRHKDERWKEKEVYHRSRTYATEIDQPRSWLNTAD